MATSRVGPTVLAAALSLPGSPHDGAVRSDWPPLARGSGPAAAAGRAQAERLGAAPGLCTLGSGAGNEGRASGHRGRAALGARWTALRAGRAGAEGLRRAQVRGGAGSGWGAPSERGGWVLAQRCVGEPELTKFRPPGECAGDCGWEAAEQRCFWRCELSLPLEVSTFSLNVPDAFPEGWLQIESRVVVSWNFQSK